jgi:hypothetical protein
MLSKKEFFDELSRIRRNFKREMKERMKDWIVNMEAWSSSEDEVPYDFGIVMWQST